MEFDDVNPETEGEGVIVSVATVAMVVVVAVVLEVMVVAMSALAFVLGAKRYCGPSCFEKYL